MVAYTTTYNLKKPTVADDEDVWGGYLNDSMDIIDDVLDGTVPVTGIDINSGTLDNVVIGGTTANSGTFTVLSATTSLGVTGNITVSGTVDGRDVAADGTKLDGIESGATADQTKADIDALGIAASTAATLATARNIALTGAVTGNVNFDGSGNVSIATTATSDPTLTLSGDASGSATFTNLGNATLSVTVADDSHNHVISNVDGLQTALDGKLSTTGKAADSNLLDGIDSGSFLRSDTADSTASTISFTGDIQVGDQIFHHGDTDTYLQFDAANQWRVVTGGTERLQVTNSGIGIGNTSPNGNLANGKSIVLGDSDTGFRQNGDGVLELWANNQEIIDINTSRAYFYKNIDMGGRSILEVEDIYVRDKIFHDDDTDTYIGFGTNTINFRAGNVEMTYNTSGLFIKDGSLREDYDALSGTSPTCNVDSAGAFSLTMTGNTTFTFSGADSGYSQGFVLQLTGNGSTVTWPTSVKWAGGTAPDAPASGETDIYVFWTRDNGTNWYGVLSSDAAA